MLFGNGTNILKDSEIFDYPLMSDLASFQRFKIPTSTSSSNFHVYNITSTETLDKTVFEKNGHNAIAMVLLMLSLMIIIVGTIVGNVLVCIAVCLVRKLRRPYNYLLVSLAISDLCVAVLVMPMALLHELLGKWQFGQMACDVWVSFDVLSCTASILNLCMISVDRYLAITKPLEYGVKRTPKRMIAYIFFVWIGAAFVSVPPVLILGNEHGDGSICQVCQNFWYQIYATFGSFYIPLTVMVIVYFKIFQAAKRIVNEERKAQIHLKLVDDHTHKRSSTPKQSKSGPPSTTKNKSHELALSQCQPSADASRCVVVQINNGEVETKLAPCFPNQVPTLDKGVWVEEEESVHRKLNSNCIKNPDNRHHCHSYSIHDDNSLDKTSNGSQVLEVPIEEIHQFGSASPVSTTTTTFESTWSLTHSKVEAITIDTNFKESHFLDKPKENVDSNFVLKNITSENTLGLDNKAKSVKPLPRGSDIEIDITNCDELEEDNILIRGAKDQGDVSVSENTPKKKWKSFCEKDNSAVKTRLLLHGSSPNETTKLTKNVPEGPHSNESPSSKKDFFKKGANPPQLHLGKRKSSDDNQSSKRNFLHPPKSKLRITLAKERKASTTLGIIMSAFIICWLPFFVLALVRPFLTDLNAIPNSISSLFLWLGYANSLLNPIIYATLNKDFRKPFQEILCLRCSSLNILMREEFYHSQYGPDTPNHSHVRYCVNNPRDQDTLVAVGSTNSENKESQRFNSTSQQDIIAECRF